LPSCLFVSRAVEAPISGHTTQYIIVFIGWYEWVWLFAIFGIITSTSFKCCIEFLFRKAGILKLQLTEEQEHYIGFNSCLIILFCLISFTWSLLGNWILWQLIISTQLEIFVWSCIAFSMESPWVHRHSESFVVR
jgi:hypothetical protein